MRNHYSVGKILERLKEANYISFSKPERKKFLSKEILGQELSGQEKKNFFTALQLLMLEKKKK